MWNPNVVLHHFISLPENKDLFLIALILISHKLVISITLACVLRVSEFAAFCISSINSINLSQSSLFSIFRPRKTQHLATLHSFSLPRLSGPSCSLDCLAVYVDRTAALRQKDSGALFISLKRPHKEVGSSTAVRWRKQGLSLAGISNIIGIGAHSVQGSSTATQTKVPVD